MNSTFFQGFPRGKKYFPLQFKAFEQQETAGNSRKKFKLYLLLFNATGKFF